jgi:hypothetical protein
MKQQSSFIAKKRPNSKCIEQDVKDCHWATFKYAMEFFKQPVNFKKPLPKHYFANFFKDLSNEDLVVGNVNY